ncbi:uncharacterized protein METZ01_LOCUS126465 [marine metagenome]|uniref:Uncharacterized protein n=1 Tax=marine metagenome TaxID=408172 RepID=A0A381YAI5_9ZZZZ
MPDCEELVGVTFRELISEHALYVFMDGLRAIPAFPKIRKYYLSKR